MKNSFSLVLSIFILELFIINNSMASKSKESILRTIEWREISNKEGITVYIPAKYDHDSGLVPIKFKAKIDHNIAKVLTVLADNQRKLEWLPKLKKVKLLDKKSMNDFTVYYRYDAPWPFKDRDFIVRNLGSFDLKSFTVSVDIKSVSHDKDPHSEDTVRGSTYDGYSIIRPSGLTQTEVEIAFLNDFGGYIPKFIINIVQKKWPYKFMKHLREQLKKTDIKTSTEFILDTAKEIIKE